MGRGGNAISKLGREAALSWVDSKLVCSSDMVSLGSGWCIDSTCTLYIHHGPGDNQVGGNDQCDEYRMCVLQMQRAHSFSLVG